MTQWSWPGLVVLALACTVGEPVGEGAPAPSPAETEPGRPGEPAPGAVRDAAAAELLARAQLAYDAAEAEEALALAAQLVEEYGHTSAAVGARWVAARAAFALGDYEAARAHARAYAEAQPSGSTQRADGRLLAELADDMLRPADAPTRVGAIVPRTGSRVMVRYGDWILEGIELAVEEFERRYGRAIELVVADDGGGARTAEAVRELERQGIVAIVGPLLPQQLAVAAGSRSDPQLVLVSPTVPDAPLDYPDVYTVNAGDTRGAQELAVWAARAGFGVAAVLYARTADHQRKAQAFAVEFEEAGGAVRAVVPYDSGTTTFEPHLRRILAGVAPGLVSAADTGAAPVGTPEEADWTTRPDSLEPWTDGARPERFVLFVSAPERDVRQIAPQIAYYGLDAAGAQVLGDEAWASSSLRRVVPSRDLEGVVAAAHRPPDRAEGIADPAFVDRYEETYRRSLDNQLPALGYDAARVLLEAMPNRMQTARAWSFRVRLLTGVPGATGRLSVRGQRIVRDPVIVVIRNGALVEAPAPETYIVPATGASPPADSTGASPRR